MPGVCETGVCWGSLRMIESVKNRQLNKQSKKSPTGPTERTPKPEYLITLPTYLGVRW